MPFCLRIRNCSGERTARHSSSDFWTDPGPAMATIPLLKLLLTRPENPDDNLLLDVKWVLDKLVERKRGVEEDLLIRVLESEKGEIFRIWEPMWCFCMYKFIRIIIIVIKLKYKRDQFNGNKFLIIFLACLVPSQQAWIDWWQVSHFAFT